MAVLVGKKAPIFDSKAVINGNEIVDSLTLEQFEGQYKVLFSLFFSIILICILPHTIIVVSFLSSL